MSMSRLAWHDLPADTRAAVHEHTGPFLTSADVTTGANSGVAVKAYTSAGPVFIKGIPTDHRQVKTQRREADVNPYLPPSAPKLLWHTQGGGWDLLGFELIDGSIADYTPGSPDLPLVVAALTELADTPCPDIPLLDLADRYASYTSTPELFGGEALLHTDVAPHNVLVDSTAHLIDWAWPTRGPAWADPAVWVVRLIEAGHTPEQAEQWAAKVPGFRTAHPHVLAAFADANAHQWEEVRALEPRSLWKQRMTASAAAWRDHQRALALRTDA
ncbi:aminoglycoside phosphotransferase [Streptacidiphilus sp. P02-A3a]|uniref:aminoglycoside phosphotransferase n=1 Tax=Streptacidiphilus sp. P02-A3a TaxID=2704468 RepID=UPI0015F99D84|nr:aminoglycoside phosphotransferase [Streptacidiphilus sp. P02-A3a]QMU67087.1 aminoglycoside phosphotransferase [Streptacidiphilus sp. P02-A3a]